MITSINLENILFLDIETVPENASFQELDDDFKTLFSQKHSTSVKMTFLPKIL